MLKIKLDSMLICALAAVIIILLSFASATAQDAYKLIFGEVYYDGEAYSNLRELCDDIGGRVAGTEAGYAAEKWALAKFESYSLSNVHFEKFNMPGWERGSLDVRLKVPEERPVTAVALANTPSKAKVTARLIDLGHGHPDEYEAAGESIRGRIVLAEVGTPSGKRSVHRVEKVTLAEQYGAEGFVLITNAPGNLPRTGTCRMGEYADIPAIGATQEHGMWLRRYLVDHPDAELSIDMKNKTKKTFANNVVAEIPGSELPDEIVMVGAHLDSWDLGQGAIDNGAGSVCLLEAARVLSRLQVKPKRTIRFVLFMGEEFGLYGSRAYARAHRDDLGSIVMMLNIDMPGKPYGYSVHGHPEAVGFLESLAGELHGIGMDPGRVSSGAGLHSDHQPFMLLGVPTMSISGKLEESMWRYYHSAGDTFDKASETYMNDYAAVAATTLLKIANAPERLARRFTNEETRQMLIDNNLKDPLVILGDWRWED